MLGTEHEMQHSAEAPSTSEAEERSPLARSAAKLLYKRMRVREPSRTANAPERRLPSHPPPPSVLKVTVADGRVLVGDFICLDKQGNIILNNAVERYVADGKEEEKLLGQVLVPATQRRSAAVEAVVAERQTILDVIDGTLQNSQ